MQVLSLRSAAILAGLMVVGLSSASPNGVVSTDRFGYTGLVTRYDTLADAQSGNNAVGTYEIGNRDLSLYVAHDFPTLGNYSYISGSWWYTTDSLGRAGWGNVHGNSGQGYTQLSDAGGLTINDFSGTFGGYNGTYYTNYTMSLQGSGADYSHSYSRFWTDFQGGGADKVYFNNYSLNLTATGLQGIKTGDLIESTNHPLGVVGTYSGIFQNVSTTYKENNGFYAFSLKLDMDNWAYENRDSLTGQYKFADSYFGEQVAVPAPAAALPFLLGLLARRRKK